MESNQNIKVLIVEDHPISRIGLRMALRYAESGFDVVGEVENARQAVEFLQAHGKEIDLILLDYFLPDGTGMDVIGVAKVVSPEIKMLLITGYTLDASIMSKVEQNIDGFISKTVKPEELKTCIEALFRNRESKKDKEAVITLSLRELQIVRLCVEGKTAQEIADALNLSKRTVEGHKERIFSKLNCNSTVELVNYAYRNGLVC